MANKTPSYYTLFSILILAIILFSFIFSHDRNLWVLELFPVLIGFPVLFFTYKRFQFTRLVYTLVIIHCIILAIGAVYTYAKVPLGFWMQDWFGFPRNNYDKIGHFVQGFIPAIMIRELLLRTSPLRKSMWIPFIVLSCCLAISALYEIVEWWVSAAKNTSAEDFLGTQGYEWDTQSDMLWALIGAAAALLSLSKLHNKILRKNKLI